MRKQLKAIIVHNIDDDAPDVPGAIEYVGKPRDPRHRTGIFYNCPCGCGERLFKHFNDDLRIAGTWDCPTVHGVLTNRTHWADFTLTDCIWETAKP